MLIVAAAMVVACGEELGPVDPGEDTAVAAPVAEAEAVQPAPRDRNRPEDDALSIEDMLGDPWFIWLVEGIEEPTLADPLADAVDALSAGQVSRSRGLIAKADDEAEALEDDPDAAEAVFYWSILERFFEEAELI